LHNFIKQHLILAKFHLNNALSIGNQNVKFKLNLSTQTIFKAAFVNLSQNVKCPVLGNRLFNPDSVHNLLENFVINFLAPYLFFCLNSLIKTLLSAEKIILLLFTFF